MKFFSCLLMVFMAGCSTGINPGQYVGTGKTYSDFTMCHGYGCSNMLRMGLHDNEWDDVLKPLKKPAQSAEEERNHIAQAAAKFEGYMQKISGLPEDRAEASHLPEDAGQMDCIDETINLSQFLSFVQTEGVLIYHKPVEPIHRGYFVDGKWPHNTAAIQELTSGHIYAVDGFYRKGGEEPYIIEKKVWMNNWRPSKQP